MPRLPEIKPAQFVRAIRKLGFELDRQRGSHAIYFREKDKKRLVVPIHNKALKKGTLRGLIADLGMSVEDFLNLM